MALISCPLCAKRFDPEHVASRPFCSDRCRQIDLGRWLSEKYSVPDLGPDPEEDDGNHPPEGHDCGDSGRES